MTKLALHDTNGKQIGDVEIAEGLLSGPVRKGLLYYVVRYQLMGRRAGTHSTKTRGMVQGSTKKIYRQKGTGNARHGDIKAPIFVGGGRIFGPHPRDYSFTMPKKAKRRGLQSALILKNKENRLLVVEEPKWKDIKTKHAIQFFKGLNCTNGLLVISQENEVIEKSVRNLKGFKVLRAPGLNVFDVLKYEHLILTPKALEQVQGRLQIN